MKAQFLYNPPDKGLYCHSPSLLQTVQGDLLAAWYTYPEEEHKEGSLVLARWPAGAKQWSPAKGILGPFESSAGNPVLFQTPGNAVWLIFVLLKGTYWTDAELTGTYSIDGGHTWSPPATLWHERGMMIRHPPVLVGNKSILLPAYLEGSRRSVLLRSQPPYTNWQEAYCFDDLDLIQPVLMRLGPRQLAIYFRPWSDPRQIWRSYSSDDGATWSPPMRTPLPNPLSGISAFAYGSRIAVVYNHTEKHQRYPLSLSVTSDHGVTWAGPWHIETQPFEVCYPSFLVEPGGQVHGVYTYNRRMIKYVTFSTGEMESELYQTVQVEP